MAVPKGYAKWINKYGKRVDKLARKKYGIDGPTLLAKLLQGESGFSMKAVSSANARGAAQFIPSTRSAILSQFGVDPWRSKREAVLGAVIHLKGKLGNATGLEGYNPGGGQSYVNYILGQDVGKIPGVVGTASGGGGATTPVSITSQLPGFRKAVAPTATIPLREISNALAPQRAAAKAVMPEQSPAGFNELLARPYVSPATEQELSARELKEITNTYQVPTGSAASGSPVSLKGIKGAWGGSKPALYEVLGGLDRYVSSGKRTPGENSAAGGSPTSDHLTTNTNAYAVDMSATGATGDRIARRIARRLGVKNYSGGILNVNKGKFRFQLIWRAEGHYDHVHLGVRRL